MTDEAFITGITTGISDKDAVIFSVFGSNRTISLSLPKHYAKQLAIRILMIVQEIEDNKQLIDKEFENG